MNIKVRFKCSQKFYKLTFLKQIYCEIFEKKNNKKMVLSMPNANNEVPGQTTHARSVTRVFSVRRNVHQYTLTQQVDNEGSDQTA